MVLRSPSLEVLPLTLAATAVLPVTILLAEICGVHPAFLAHAPAGVAMLCLIAAWAYGSWRRLALVPIVCELAFTYMNIVLAVLIYSYVTLRPALPLADATLFALDARLGISVPAIVHWVDASPGLSWLMEMSYNSLGLQMGALPVALALSGNTDRAGRLLVAQLAICVIGCTISIGWPALGSFDFAGIRMEDLKHLGGVVGYQFHEGFYRARHDGLFVLTTELISGVSTFPSIHAALAILCAWAAWPMRWLRVPFLLLNAGMYVSTIPVGAHYGIDVVAGTLLAACVILAARRLPDTLWRRALVWPGSKGTRAPAGGFA